MSQKDVPDYFAFYPYEFLSDERVLAMSLEQVGAYLMLIISQWINGSIPADLPTLAAILRRDEAGMDELWARVGPCFDPHPTDEGRLIQKRVEVERANAIGAMARAAQKQAEYRERKRLRDEAKRLEDEAKRLLDGAVAVTDTSQKSNVTKPSNLICSSLSTKDSKKEEKRSELDALWSEFKTLYPAARLKEELTCRAFLSRDDEAPAILAGLRLAVTSEEWQREGGKFVPSSERFIADGRYKDAGRLTQPGAQASTCESTMDPETARRLAERRACANQ